MKSINNVVNKTIESYEKIAESYNQRWYNSDSIKDVLNSFINELTGCRVLDIGCGPGRDAKYLTERGFDVTGIDLTDSFLEIASQNVPTARFVKMDMRFLDFPADYYDGIWACASFLHIPYNESKKTLRGFYRVLKEGGIICLSVKEGEGEMFIEKSNKDKRFFAFYNRDGFKSLIQSSGFDILQTQFDHNFDNWINVIAKK